MLYRFGGFCALKPFFIAQDFNFVLETCRKRVTLTAVQQQAMAGGSLYLAAVSITLTHDMDVEKVI